MPLTRGTDISVPAFEPEDILNIHCSTINSVKNVVNCNNLKFIVEEDICFRFLAVLFTFYTIVARHLRCGGIFNNQFITCLLNVWESNRQE